MCVYYTTTIIIISISRDIYQSLHYVRNVVYCVKGFRKIYHQTSNVGVRFQKFGHVMVEND